MTINRTVLSGNRIEVQFNTAKIGLLQSIDNEDDFGLEPASGIGNPEAQEYVPTFSRHTLSFTNLVLEKNGLRSMGIIPENGADALKGFVFDVVFFKDDQPIRTYSKCSVGRCSTQIQKHTLLMQSGTIMACSVSGKGY